MTMPGKVYVGSIGTDHWLAKGWKELGYTTEDGLLVEGDDQAIWRTDNEKIPVPKLAGLGEITKTFELTAKQMRAALSMAGFLFYAPKYRRPEHVRRMRQAYRLKRGRRRFR